LLPLLSLALLPRRLGEQVLTWWRVRLIAVGTGLTEQSTATA
jgi:hypothetical protein